MARVSPTQIGDMKRRGEKIPMLTAYDYSTARFLDEAGIPLILVGDSLGTVMLGYGSTIPVTMDEMIHHCKAVARGARNAMVIGDMPFMTYHLNSEQALVNAARFIQEGGCQAVKLEGGVTVAEKVRRVVECGIPVMGHIGLTPQSELVLGYRVQGRSADAAIRIVKDALALEEAGVFAIVLETVPAPLAKLITERVSVPTIGIGAGIYCDGQVQVIHDFMGMFPDFTPKHAKQFAQVGVALKAALAQYMTEVKEGSFPTDKESFKMDEAVVAEVAAAIPARS